MGTPSPVIIRTYRARNQDAAVRQYEKDAATLAQQGYYPTSQSWAQGSWGCGAFLVAFLLTFFLIGILVFIYMLLVKPYGTLTVTYEYRPSLSSSLATASVELHQGVENAAIPRTTTRARVRTFSPVPLFAEPDLGLKPFKYLDAKAVFDVIETRGAFTQLALESGERVWTLNSTIEFGNFEPPAPPAPETKVCPRCAETVKYAAQVCRFCGHEFEATT